MPSNEHRNSGVRRVLGRLGSLSGFGKTSDRLGSTENNSQQNREQQPISAQPGDYDEGANQLWKTYVTEAESHDRALIETWKDDMESIIIFAGLFSASLTAFLVESYKNLKADPSVQFSNQTVTLLIQISRQLAASNGQGATTLSFPDPQNVQFLGPTGPDVRINIFWFMSLVFSLSAALFATIVQQWVRDYMHQVFRRYSHPLKSARIREFLSEGADFWRMSVIVDTIPTLIHISLALFFIGLGEFLYNIDTVVATWTTAAMSFSGLLYAWTMLAPLFDPQSPYQSPASGIFWYLFQSFFPCRRQHKDPDKNYRSLPVSTDLTNGRMHIAMNCTAERKMRDAQAIEWAIDNLTEDSELQPLVEGIPGSLTSEWGLRVWQFLNNHREKMSKKQAAGNHEDIDHDEFAHRTDSIDIENNTRQSRPQRLGIVSFVNLRSSVRRVMRIPSPFAHTNNKTKVPVAITLSRRIARMLKTCTEDGILTNEDRKKRARVCIDATLQLVLSLQDKHVWLSDSNPVCRTLVYLGQLDKSTIGGPLVHDSAFAARRACMTVIVVQQLIQSDKEIRGAAHQVVEHLADVVSKKQLDINDRASKIAALIDEHVGEAWNLADEIRKTAETVEHNDEGGKTSLKKDGLLKITQKYEELDDVHHHLRWARRTSVSISELAELMRKSTGGVLEHLHGSFITWSRHDYSPTPSDTISSTWILPKLLPPLHLVERLWLSASGARTIESQDGSMTNLKSLGTLSAPELTMPEVKEIMTGSGNPFQMQLWRAIDIREGGTVFLLELLAGALKKPGFGTEGSSKVWVDAFRAITANWDYTDPKFKKPNPGTPRLLVALLRETVPISNRDIRLPIEFIEELIRLAGKVVARSSKKDMQEVAKEALETLREVKTHSPEVTFHWSAVWQSSLDILEGMVLFLDYSHLKPDERIREIKSALEEKEVVSRLLVDFLQTVLEQTGQSSNENATDGNGLLFLLEEELVSLTGRMLKGRQDERAIEVLTKSKDAGRGVPVAELAIQMIKGEV